MPNTQPPTPYPPPTFTAPTPYGYIYAGFSVDPPKHAPFVSTSRRRDNTIADLGAAARRLRDLPQVIAATVFRAVFMPPLPDLPRFDVALLVRTHSADSIREVQESPLLAGLGADSIIGARNSRRIGVTEPFAPDATRHGETAMEPGTYLFNHFTADDPDRATAAWEQLTGWYTAKIGVDNSTLLRPLDGSPYAVINYVRLPASAPLFLINQFRRPSFRAFVRPTLRENGMTALPLFFSPVPALG